MPLWLLWALVWLALACSCAASAPAPEPLAAAPVAAAASASAWRATVRPDAALERLTTDVCFEGAPSPRIKPQTSRAAVALASATWIKGQDSGPLEVGRGGVVALGAMPPGACARLVFSVDALLRSAGHRADSLRYREAVVLSPDHWLWTPSPRPRAEATARFELPPGLRVAVPWPRVEGEADTYRITPQVWKWRNHAAFGRFDEETLEVAQGRLEVRWIDEERLPLGRARLRAWLLQAAQIASSLHGRFPVDRAQVLVMPTRGDDVTFGTVARGGGFSVALMVGRDITEEALEDDWVATHELIHLCLPRIDNDSPWLYEGFATYYEPVLRARAGDLPSRRAWERLHDGFLRGAGTGTGRTLRQESADMFQTYAFWRVYWSGAALALMADVALRTGGQGHRSLDEHVAAVRGCCLERGVEWQAEALLEALVADPRDPSLLTTARAWLDGSDFPPLEEVYRLLGLRFDPQGRLLTRPGDPGAELRIAIMGRDVEP